MSSGYDTASNSWTITDDTGNVDRARIYRDGGGAVLYGQYVALTLADPATGGAAGGSHRITSAGNGTFVYQVSTSASDFNNANTAWLVAPSGAFTVPNLSAGTATMTGLLKLAPYTVGTLPTCNAANRDAAVVVTDAASPTYRGTLTGGGTVRTPAYCDGVAWTAH